MKKIISILIIVISVVIFCVAGYFAYKAYLQNRNPIEVADDYVNTVKERREYVFQAPKVTETNVLLEPDDNYRTVQLYLGDNKLYPVNVPADDVILTDYTTYIYNVDNSYSVQVVKGVTKDNMESMFSMKNTEKLTNTIVKTKEGRKEPQAVGTLLYDDIGVVMTCYNNSEAYATMLDGVQRNRIKNADYNNPNRTEDCYTYTSAMQIPNNDVYPFSIQPNEFNGAGTKQYIFEDGQLTQFAVMLGYDDALQDMYNRVNTATFGEAQITAECATDGTRYLELGDFTILVNAPTINKSNCFLGQGKEARYNIITYYKQYCK